MMKRHAMLERRREKTIMLHILEEVMEEEKKKMAILHRVQIEIEIEIEISNCRLKNSAVSYFVPIDCT